MISYLCTVRIHVHIIIVLMSPRCVCDGTNVLERVKTCWNVMEHKL